MKTETLDLRHMDCMELMRSYPDNHFDLAVVDPPYGIGADGTLGFATKKTKGFTFTAKEYAKKNWDNQTPDIKYFEELKRVSKYQIIWGANYFANELGVIKNFIYWHKKGKSEDTKFNEGELAYVSKGRTRMVDIWWNGFGVINSGEKKQHPTQKPVKLYDWIFANYAEKGMKILDTHMGSGSIAIAAHYAGMNLTACELDADYYKAACERIHRETSQTTFL